MPARSDFLPNQLLLEDAQANCPTPPSATPLWILQRRRVSALKAAHRSEAFPERSCLMSRLQQRLRDPEQEGRVADRHYATALGALPAATELFQRTVALLSIDAAARYY